MPGTLFLLAMGSFVREGDVELRDVLLLSLTAVVLGDQLGYLIGRIAGRRAVNAFSRRFEGGNAIRRAEAFTTRWGAPGIFFSRWLVTALGPWVNLSSGVTEYTWPRFLFWDILGEMVWVGLYVGLGMLFSDRVQELADLLGSVGWLLLALIVVGFTGWELVRHLHHEEAPVEERPVEA